MTGYQQATATCTHSHPGTATGSFVYSLVIKEGDNEVGSSSCVPGTLPAVLECTFTGLPEGVDDLTVVCAAQSADPAGVNPDPVSAGIDLM